MITVRLEQCRTAKALDTGMIPKWSQVARDTGLTEVALWYIRKEPNRGISMETINILCNYFGAGIDELLEFTPDFIQPHKERHYAIKSFNTNCFMA